MPKTENKEAMNEKALEIDYQDTKKVLELQPKRRIFIPIDEINQENEVFVGINGVFYYIKKGQEVEVPEDVAKVWEESYKMQMEARKKYAVTSIEA